VIDISLSNLKNTLTFKNILKIITVMAVNMSVWLPKAEGFYWFDDSRDSNVGHRGYQGILKGEVSLCC
jgi:hypothetical protein